jgi:hypothetical protein
MRYSKEVQEFIGFVKKGFPLTVLLIIVSIIIATLFAVLPPVAYGVGVIIILIFGTAALGIVKDIADND